MFEFGFIGFGSMVKMLIHSLLKFSKASHIMYNLSRLNGILQGLRLEESDWWAYNEKEA